MGWDAYSNPKPKGKAKQSFISIVKEAQKVSPDNMVDGGLDDYYLDTSHSGKALESLTGLGVYDDRGWSPELVEELWDRVKDQDITIKDYGDASAYYFLKACAENNLGIRFSW